MNAVHKDLQIATDLIFTNSAGTLMVILATNGSAQVVEQAEYAQITDAFNLIHNQLLLQQAMEI